MIIPNTDELEPNFNEIKLLTDITKDSYALLGLDNTFCVFKSINDILYLIYTNIDCSIISYNLIENKKINEIKNAHTEDITNFRYYLDKINKRDLLLSTSAVNNNLKIWNINNFECILNIHNVNNTGILKSSCFLYDNNTIYIITSNYNDSVNNIKEGIKVFDLNGNKIKDINDSNDDIIYITTYYDINLSSNFIISGNNGYILSYNFNDNSIYMKYVDGKNYYDHSSIIIIKSEEMIKMVESCGDGLIRIWNFHTAEILNRIYVCNCYLYGMHILNGENILVGCRDKKIRIVDVKNSLIKKEIEGHNKEILTIKKIFHPQFGECLISQGKSNDQIKLWKI